MAPVLCWRHRGDKEGGHKEVKTGIQCGKSKPDFISKIIKEPARRQLREFGTPVRLSPIVNDGTEVSEEGK